MVENIVVKDQLTADMIEVGGELVRRLDELGVPVNAALWLFTAEAGEWRLLMASSEVSAGRAREVYRRIRSALDDLGEKALNVPFSTIGLLDADAELVRHFRTAMSTGPVITTMRFHRGTINGHFIEDALIYRVV
jgi:hypothetical protein